MTVISRLGSLRVTQWLVTVLLLVATCALADESDGPSAIIVDAMSCEAESLSNLQSEQALSWSLDPVSEHPLMVEVGIMGEGAPEATPDYWLVDLRPHDLAGQHLVPGALSLDWLGFRALLRNSQRPIVAMGVGDDDASLAQRLATVADVDRVRLLSGGVAAWVLAGKAPELLPQLQALLSLPSDRALAGVSGGSLRLLAMREPERRLIPVETVVLPSSAAASMAGSTALIHWLEAELSGSSASLVLAGDPDSNAAGLSVALSKSLGQPVFHVQGGIEALEAQARRFANINRQARPNVSPCR